MSNKGKVFTHKDFPRATQERLRHNQVPPEELQRLDAWLQAQTERYRIVAMDGDTPLIAEELVERSLRKHANMGADQGPLLVQLRNLMQLSPQQRVWVLDSFDEKGELIIPFDPPPEKKAEAPRKKPGK